MPRYAATIVAAVLLLSACSVKKHAMESLGDTLTARLSDSFASDNDPELVRAAAPFSLKLIESLIADSPRSEPLLLSAAKGFTQYSYAFVQQDADRAQAQSEATALRGEAAKLYLRGRDYGMRGLELRHPGFADALKAAPRATADRASLDDVPFLYWTGLSWAGALAASRDVFMLPQIPQFEALLERVLQLDEAFQQGAVHTFFISFEMSSPTRHGDKAARAKEHFDRAVALSKGHLAAPYVSYAENVMAATRNRDEFSSLLRTALKIDVNAEPGSRLQNLVFQGRARWLLGRVDKIFH